MIVRLIFYILLLGAISILIAESSLPAGLSITSPSGLAHYLIFTELLVLAILFFYLSKLDRLKALLISAVFFFSALLHLSTQGKPILSAGLFVPGSPGERLLWPMLSLNVDRLLEPGIWLLVVGFVLLQQLSSKAYISIICIALSVYLELIYLVFEAEYSGLKPALSLIHYILIQAALLHAFAILVTLKEELPKKWNLELDKKRLVYCCTIYLFIPLIFLACSKFIVSEKNTLIGAYYYSWFPENWKGGYSGQKFAEVIEPVEGLYRSADQQLFSKHLAQAKEAGIDFFIFDWWPGRRDVRNKFDPHLKGDLGDFKFALHYETLDLLTLRKKKVLDSNIVKLEDDDFFQAKKHFEHLAKNYFNHPAYLRVEGKPIVFMYATRHLVGETSKFITSIRKHLRETTGDEVYIVGDEVFENVISIGAAGEAVLNLAYRPDWERLLSFDAITSYNPYDPASKTYEGGEVEKKFKSKVVNLYRHYSTLADKSNLRFIPTALPGYDDRALRPSKSHPPLNREQGEFFSWFLSEASKYIDPKLGIITITSWNEWNEGTQIEPAKLSRASEKLEGAMLTSSYEAYHRRYLEILNGLKK